MGRLFGTDGARGIANTELTCEMAMQIGRAAAIILTKQKKSKAKILIGKDTRISSDLLENALKAGICSVGANAEILGVVPTPAVAYLVTKYKADAGIMISASHNPVEYNGIKIFSGSGYKLSDEIEEEIEKLILDNPEKIVLKSGVEIGTVTVRKNAVKDYIRSIMLTVDDNFNGIKIAIDCANGSASQTAYDLFLGLKAEAIFINNQPDGANINKNCGSLHLEQLAEIVVKNKCAIGVAFDGDADRCLAVDENGAIIDGDKMLSIFSNFMKKEGSLKNNTTVVTVMTNLGFFHYAKNNEINVVTTGVGDRYVLEEMRQNDYNLGGEQSGHIIFSDFAKTGDGQLCAVQLINILKQTKKKASELAKIMETFPQALVNVKLKEGGRELFEKDNEIKQAIKACEKLLGDDGRILVRASGTEPLIRIMVEAKSDAAASAVANEVAKLIKKKVGINEDSK